MRSQTHVIPNHLLETAKTKLIKQISTRVNARKHKMIDCINQSVIKYNPYFQNTFAFDIKDGITQKITNNITNVLSQWDGDKSYKHAITKEKQTFKHTFDKVRLYWSRTKSKPLGDHLFNCIIACLFQYVMDGF
eukprot:452080_1